MKLRPPTRIKANIRSRAGNTNGVKEATLIAAALGPESARTWLAHSNIHVLAIPPADLEEGRRAIEEGSAPPHATLTDTIHLAVLDRLGVTDVFAVDRAFLAMLG